MLASIGDASLTDPQLVYEPKYDGIRAIAEVWPEGRARLWSRLGNDKTAQFPEVSDALAHWGRRLRAPVVLDGEIVALDARGQPIGFQNLQGRIHTTARAPAPQAVPVAFIVFDVLKDGDRDYRDRPLVERRAALVQLVSADSGTIRLSEQVVGDGRRLYSQALARGWEGLIAKRADSRYKSGARTPDWRKLKIVQVQEFVIGGWTEPRNARSNFGALLLGVYDGRRLEYVGHSGTGFTEAELDRVMARLRPLESRRCPFAAIPPSNERPHWVEPKLVAQVKFTEWTTDGRLRHPVYLGLRDDKRPTDVHREEVRTRTLATHAGTTVATPLAAGGKGPRPSTQTAPRSRAGAAASKKISESRQARDRTPSELDVLISTLTDLEHARRDGTLRLGDGRSVAVTNLDKIFWPALGLTKGDLLRYYVRIAPFVLPVVRDRPLVMKRFPNGIAGKPFYQHRAEHIPEGIRVEDAPASASAGGGRVESRPHIIGGDLATLLYTTQLAAISLDPWFSRVQSPDEADFVALDLDPPEGVPFRRVLDVARWIRDVLSVLDVVSVPKTSGSRGLHVYVPLAPGTPYEAGLLFGEIVATLVAHQHPRQATVERAIAARRSRVYVDYLQNGRGKTLASAYSARASAYAGVSTPLTWDEVEAGVDREDFTIRTVPDRVKEIGDLWSPLRQSRGVDLAKAAKLLR
jgi:bifunctional non-homologous end joining protein LigD